MRELGYWKTYKCPIKVYSFVTLGSSFLCRPIIVANSVLLKINDSPESLSVKYGELQNVEL